MKMEQSTVFKSNQSQAVRLPKAVALPESVKRVDIVKLGNSRLITPAGTAWDSWFDGPGVTDDFMVEREQPVDQERDLL
jgi:antitoxin VapB